MANKGKKNHPKKKVNGYKMPPPIPPGEIIRHGDKEWKIGPSIGVGGFGEIYSACEYKNDESPPADLGDYPFVVKIEPEENGPLFVEMHFYNRNYHEDDIQDFMKSRNLSMLGMPRYIGSGTVNIKGEALRFLIVERYGTDLWKIFNQVGKKFPAPTVFQLGLQMIDVLDYIHSRSYIHADIKGSNILLGIKEGTENQAYLLDFGLAYRIVDDNYKPDPKSAHEGTIEYTSTDRHIGAKTMRGDLEILGYNLFHWLVGTLPWEGVLDKPQVVHQMKSDFVNNVRAKITTDYPDVPDALIQFFEYIRTLEPQDQPDYSVCRHIFERYLTSVGKTRSSQLEFKATEEDHSQSDVDENQKQIIINNKNNVEKYNFPVSVSDGNKVIEVTDNNEVDIEEKKKITSDKKSEIISLTESDSISELVESNQERQVTKNKKSKGKKSDEIVQKSENDAEIEQPDENQEKKFTKSKKNKDKRDKNLEVSIPVTSDDKNEEAGDNKEEKPAKNKKNKKQKDKHLHVTLSAENNTETDQPNENHEQNLTKVKKTKKDNAYFPPLDNDDKIDQIYDYQEENIDTVDFIPFSVSNNNNDKRKRDKKQRDTSPTKNDDEPEQPDDNHVDKVSKVRKSKKQKGKKLKDSPSADNNSDIEQIDDNQDKELNKKKKKSKKKRDKIVKNTSSAENDDENDELSDDEQTLIEIVKNKEKRINGKKAKDTSAESTEHEQMENDQEQEVSRLKKSKRKRAKKSEVVSEPVSEVSEDYDQPIKKKRKSSKTPSKKKYKAKAYPKDSEDESQDKTRNKKRVKIKFDKDSTFWPKLPVKQVEPDTAFPERELRCKYRKTRPNYTGI